MRSPWHIAVISVITLAACAPSPGGGAPPSEPVQSSVRHGGTLRLAWAVEPDTLGPKFVGGSGTAEYQNLFSATLALLDLTGAPRPLLAAEIPTQANGGWIVNPDGTMITTYRLRPNAKWHDGMPLTAQDFVFAFEVYTDRELPVLKKSPENLMESVEAQDDSTVVIRWREPYVGANVLGFEQLVPLPRHHLETKYRTNKANFTTGQEWTTAYISTGPFKVERWTPGIGVLATANMDFAIGPPKLDAIDIRFIPDPNTEVANLLAGEVDMINSPGVRVKEAVIARDQWSTSGDGYIKTWSTGAPYIHWQFREAPNWQRAIADFRVRQALLHAIDREGLNEAINLGFAPMAHAFVSPEDPLFPEVDRAVTKYSFDPNRSAALMAEAGWQRPPGGGPATNAAGQTFDADLYSTISQGQAATIMADNWKTAGVNTKLLILSLAQSRDAEFASSFNAASATNRPLGQDYFVWTAKEFPTPENRWSGLNAGSFFDSEVDRLQNVRMTSLVEDDRRRATIALMKRMTDVVGPSPVLYSVEVVAARSYVVGPAGRAAQSGVTWNVHEWEVTR
ncbi:MAG: hypothetical protein HW416_713 [Chloroflexi bacterium]|nr:hypothetical protein [Chloroflexota bacterium]